MKDALVGVAIGFALAALVGLYVWSFNYDYKPPLVTFSVDGKL